jgi:hypothetical protein
MVGVGSLITENYIKNKMRWFPKHKDGELRYSTWFAFFPTRLKDKSKVWLEKFTVAERYCDRTYDWWVVALLPYRETLKDEI